MSLSQAEAAALEPVAPPVDEIDNLIQAYEDIVGYINEQHTKLLAKQEQVQEKHHKIVQQIKQKFAELHQCLSRKETELLDAFCEYTKETEKKIEESVKETERARMFVKTERSVAEMIKAGNRTFEDISLRELKIMQHDVQVSLRKRNSELEQEILYPVFIPNSQIINVIEESPIGTLTAPGGDGEAVNESERPETNSVTEATADQLRSVNIAATLEYDSGPSPVSVQEPPEIVTHGVSVPSAPPLVDVYGDEEEPPPPPYWQAVGIDPPDTRSSPIPGGSESPLPRYSPPEQLAHKNTLELVNSFKVKRYNERKSSSLVAMATTRRIICGVDKFNNKVKFFKYNGYRVSECYFMNSDIYDVAYLGGEDILRFVITIPSVRTLVFINMDDANFKTWTEKKLQLKIGYTSVARGTTSDTLVVGCARVPYHGVPVRVEIIRYNGQVVRTFTETATGAKFEYPRYIDTFQDTIIVSDWKLNTVVMMKDNGQMIGQYSGTTVSPLKEPMDLSTDPEGNVFIVNGKYGSIHLIDRNCCPLEIFHAREFMTSPRLVSFDWEGQQLVLSSQSGEVFVCDFRHGYVPPNLLEPGGATLTPLPPSLPTQAMASDPTLPCVEGMLPSTLERIPSGSSRSSNSEYERSSLSYRSSAPYYREITRITEI